MAKSSTLLSYKSRRTPAQNAVASLVVTVISFVLFGALPTQWFAAQLAYDPNLGEALFRTKSYAIYLPTDWLIWGWHLADYQHLKPVVHKMIWFGTWPLAFGLAVGVALMYKLSRYTEGMSGLHGTAHWATVKEVDKTGFIPAPGHTPSGVVVGSVMLDRKGEVIHPHHPRFEQRYEPIMIRPPKRFRKVQKRNEDGHPMFQPRKRVVNKVQLLRDGGKTHLFCYAPTRSGKGVGLVIPTLLTWPHSVLVNDIKGENWALTAGFRSKAGQVAMKFEPACQDGSTARWNPLDEIRIFTLNDVQDAQMIMMMVCDPKGEGLEDHWAKTSWEFLVGLSLHMRYAEKDASMSGMAFFLGDPEWDSDKQMYEHMKKAEHDPEGKMGWLDSMGRPTKTHPVVANAAQTMLNKEDKERTSVLSTAKSFLSLYLDPIVAKNTSCSDFLVRDLMTGEKPVSCYYIVGPGDLERMVPLTRLFYALFIRRNASEMEFADGRSKKSYTHPMLMLIDEMPALKKLAILQEALGYVAGYGIRLFMIAQDITQIEELFGDKQAIDSGAHTRIAYAPNKIETAEKLARMTGKTTVTEEKASTSKDSFGIKPGSVSISTDKIGRDLMTADEFMSLSFYDMVVFVAGQPPIYGRKAFYYESPVLSARAKMPAPAKSAVLRVPVPTEAVRRAEAAKSSEGGVVATGGNNGGAAMEEKPPGDRWAAARAALKKQVGSAVQGVSVGGARVGNAPGGDATGKIGGEASKEVVKPRSRYAEANQTLTPEDRAAIRNMISDVALVEKVTEVSAF